MGQKHATVIVTLVTGIGPAIADDGQSLGGTAVALALPAPVEAPADGPPHTGDPAWQAYARSPGSLVRRVGPRIVEITLPLADGRAVTMQVADGPVCDAAGNDSH